MDEHTNLSYDIIQSTSTLTVFPLKPLPSEEKVTNKSRQESRNSSRDGDGEEDTCEFELMTTFQLFPNN